MPIYEYRCQVCGRKQSIFWRSLAAIEHKEQTTACQHCGRTRLVRVVSRVRVMRGASSQGDRDGTAGDGMDDALMNEMAGLDENDPRALGAFMRKMSHETGEDLGPEFNEVIGRLEKGEDPEKIEQEMGDVFGDDPSGMGGMGGMDEDNGPPEDPTVKADKAAEAADKKVTEKRRTVAMKGKGRAQAKPRAPRSSGAGRAKAPVKQRAKRGPRG